jgi:hypothetical protein
LGQLIEFGDANDRDCYIACLIQALDEVGERLDDWQQEFLVSVEVQFYEEQRELSIKQLLKLEEIWRAFHVGTVEE